MGSGPNGLAAAISLARQGYSVKIKEAHSEIGGGMRTKELTLPGFWHDVCSAIHPLGNASPFFSNLPLENFGVKWIHAPAALAHPLEDGRAVMIYPSIQKTAAGLGPDGRRYCDLLNPLLARSKEILETFLGPLRFPKYPYTMVRFGLPALLPATWMAKSVFKTEEGRAVFTGIAAHSMLKLNWPVTSSFALILGMLAHVVDWPLVQGGTQRIADAMAAIFKSLGGVIETDAEVTSLDQLSGYKAALFDLTPRQLIRISGDHMPAGYRKKLQNYRYGPGIFKVDIAIDGQIPWRAKECSQAATVHVCGNMDHILESEHATWKGETPERPFVLLAQQSLFDPTRSPRGKNTVWAYCHIPHGSQVDMTSRILDQIERFAPGFSSRILAIHTYNPQQLEAYNPNYIGGDINGGAQDITQFFTRPVLSLDPYRTPMEGVYLCSSSTPPGGGVHGMCGYWAARTASNYLSK